MLTPSELAEISKKIRKFGIALRHAMRSQFFDVCEVCEEQKAVVLYTAYECSGRSATLCVDCAPPIRR